MNEGRPGLVDVELPEDGAVSYWTHRGEYEIRREHRGGWTIRMVRPAPGADAGLLLRHEGHRWLVIDPTHTTATFTDWRSAVESLR